MVKLKGPSLSTNASGSVGNTLTFSKWKGRNYLRKTVKGANPKSPAQISMRQMMTLLSQSWASILPVNKTTWENLATEASTSPYNQYLKTNLALWRNFQTPSVNLTRYTFILADALTAETATGGVRHVTLSATVANVTTQNWGVLIFRSTSTPVIPAWDNCVAVVPAKSNTSFTWTDTPLNPGTYYYQFRSFALFGHCGPNETEVNAAAT